MADLARPILQVLQWIAAPIYRCWKYHWGLKENVDALKQTMGELESRKGDIEARLATEVVQGETKSKDEVQLWLQRVGDIVAEIKTINQRVETVRCFTRARLGKNVIQKIDEVDKLYRNGEFPNGLVVHLPQQIGEIIPTPTLGGATTLERKIEEVWAFLMGDEVGKIGVYGMGGIGKTTVMKSVNNSLVEKKEKFDAVIWVTASKASSIIKLQDAIAREIRFDISKNDDETRRASMLYAELSKRKRYVLILDDLWDVYRLDLVGIPEPSPQNGNKLVLTTRQHDVCLGMNFKPIPMKRLSKSEALNLFLDIVGSDVLSIPRMEKIVNLVVKECACLPLAIVTIAGSLKGIVDYNDWKTTLEDLKSASTQGPIEIFEKLKISYDRLNDENLQACLLYCALFPEDYAIPRDELIEYLIAEEILSRRNRQEELERGQALLNRLVRACLLENTTGNFKSDCVKMHDLIRDMALQITSNSPRFLVEARTGLKGVPDEENWKEDLAKVSLMQNDILVISSSFEAPKCPALSTLLLNGNTRLRYISSHFFLHMKGLSLLDLSNTSIKSLPESISELVNLTTLLLISCSELTYIPSVAKLTALKTLNFRLSGIKQVPQGMEKLTRLRYLDFECHLVAMPDGILCKLSNLQYLSLDETNGAKIRWGELIYLRKLETFLSMLDDLDSFNAHVNSLAKIGPISYLLRLQGDLRSFQSANIQGKTVHIASLDINESVARSGKCQLLLPQDVEILEMTYANLSSLNELNSFENVMNLKECSISWCYKLEHLFVYSSTIMHLLQGLEALYLVSVPRLCGLVKKENVASSPLPPGTFSSLKKLRVDSCHNIKRLFINPPLPNLQEIDVSDCRQLVEIISTKEDDKEEDQLEEPSGIDHPAIANFTLPKLRELYLSYLPELKDIPAVADQSLQHVRIEKCPKLKRVPCLDKEPCSPSLKYVYIDNDLWESLEWDHPNAKDAIKSVRVNASWA